MYIAFVTLFQSSIGYVFGVWYVGLEASFESFEDQKGFLLRVTNVVKTLI